MEPPLTRSSRAGLVEGRTRFTQAPHGEQDLTLGEVEEGLASDAGTVGLLRT